MFRAAFLPIIRSPYQYIGFGTFLAVVMTVCNFIKYTKADVRLRTSDDEQKGCPKHVE
jgi:hypothetical protein